MLLAWSSATPWLDLAAGAALVLVFVLVLLLALAIDARWGEPPAAIHPVVWIGRYLQACGRITTSCRPALAFTLGALAWSLGAAALGGLAFWLQSLLVRQLLSADPASPWRWLLLAVVAVLFACLLKPLLAWRMLRDEVLAVEAALAQSLPLGRERLAWLVSRETGRLSEGEVRESAIESLAENLNDSVVAPVFWFVLAGLPGAAIYRFANTADAMWGYRGQHWEWAGKWAARADDVLSWLPARLTAGLLALVAGALPLKSLRLEAGKTPSPNSGWPMAALALALGIRLRKPGVYSLNALGRAPSAVDTRQALVIASNLVFSLAVLASTAMLLIASGLFWGRFA